MDDELTEELDGTNQALVCEKCGDDAGICDRCYDMNRTCKNTEHVLTRYVIYKGEKNISKQFTEKDCCQFCKEQLGEGVFYCESDVITGIIPFYKSNSGILQAAQSATKVATMFVVNATFEEQVAKTGLTVC